MFTHVVQSKEWGDFKNIYGTPAFRVGEIQYTIHKVPFTDFYYAYAPKVDPSKIDFDEVAKSLKGHNCIAVNFDVPNVVKGSEEERLAIQTFERCMPAPRDQFARFNILLDITKTEDQLLEKMHYKHRYNIKYAEKNGVTVKSAQNVKDFETFFELFKATAIRQKYYIHPKLYYQKIWDLFHPKGLCEILTAFHDGEPLASWMFFIYDNTLYYPYGGSSDAKRNLNASTLVAWEGIKLGKAQGCQTFDMWGASKDPQDTSDAWYGFTNFKLKFGGKYVEYMHSYDFVVNKAAYDLFNTANSLRWKILTLIR
ncbi:MAG TPA: peptidoglycan bridge formation glycyltransferase FemA/FemB family protein [Candidatus Saccharimonadales bacterium]|nr:peptidoglycan bridge formation glycyltransferase FemA/FemB family protein [Candidatus Saccharimonadales bacterium]